MIDNGGHHVQRRQEQDHEVHPRPIEVGKFGFKGAVETGSPIQEEREIFVRYTGHSHQKIQDCHFHRFMFLAPLPHPWQDTEKQ